MDYSEYFGAYMPAVEIVRDTLKKKENNHNQSCKDMLYMQASKKDMEKLTKTRTEKSN